MQHVVFQLVAPKRASGNPCDSAVIPASGQATAYVLDRQAAQHGDVDQPRCLASRSFALATHSAASCFRSSERNTAA